MIKTEVVTVNGTDYEHVWSDEYRQICRDGQVWNEVYNPLNTGRVYTEGEIIENPIEENENEIPEWVQPLGSHDTYNKGDRVIHNDIIWESIIDANVYEPGIYGWNEVE